jgi:hypothetical protein
LPRIHFYSHLLQTVNVGKPHTSFKTWLARRLKVAVYYWGEGEKPYILETWIDSKSLYSQNSTLCFLQLEVFPWFHDFLTEGVDASTKHWEDGEYVSFGET